MGTDTTDSNVIAQTTAPQAVPNATPPSPTSAQNDALVKYDEYLQSITADTNKYNEVATNTNTLFGTLSASVGKLFNNMQTLDQLTSAQGAQFSLLSATMLGATEQFTAFAGVDTSRLSTFTGQAEKLFAVLENPQSGIGQTTAAVSKLGSALVSAGAPAGEVSKKIGLGLGAFSGYAKSIFTAADNQLRLQNAMAQFAGASGDINAFYAKAGPQMENMNNLLANQDKLFNAVGKSTGILDPDVLAKYSSALQQIPGGFEEVTRESTASSQSMNILTQTIQYATGAGRDYQEVTSDMSKAVLEYGVNLNSALEFTSRITDISSKYQARTEDVQRALLSSAEAFKMFTTTGDSAKTLLQGQSEVMAEYISQLRAANVPIQNAIGLFGQLSSTISSMGVANKAFLSSQTGGPGGLLGSLQIDKMMKAGDIKGVFDKVQDSMKKLAGPIITLDQVNNQQDASRYERQRMMLQQGPLGSFAKTDSEADRLIEAMQQGKAPTQLGSATESLGATASKGAQMEQLSYTKMSEIGNDVNAIRLAMGNQALTTIQNSSAARSGKPNNANALEAQALRDIQASGNKISKSDMSATAIKDFMGAMKDVPTAFSSVIKSFSTTISSDEKTRAHAAAEVSKVYAEQRLQANTLPAEQKRKRLAQLDAVNQETDAALQVGSAINPGSRAAASSHAQAAASPLGQNHGPIPVTIAPGSQLSVSVNANCPHCGTKIQSTQHASIINPASVSK